MQYLCKYAPAALCLGFGDTAEYINPSSDGTGQADSLVHRDLCAFSRSMLNFRLSPENEKTLLLLTGCCDPIRRVNDVLQDLGQPVIYVQLPHAQGESAAAMYAESLLLAVRRMEEYYQKPFDSGAFLRGLEEEQKQKAAQKQALQEESSRRLVLFGARVSHELLGRIRDLSPLPVEDLTCTGLAGFDASDSLSHAKGTLEDLMRWYAGKLLSQPPCLRMGDVSSRRELLKDPSIIGVIYSTVSFCDFYTFEYNLLTQENRLPLLKLETDYTLQSDGQLMTRIEAFLEELSLEKRSDAKTQKTPRQKVPSSVTVCAVNGKTAESSRYFVGTDSGSTSTNCVILNEKAQMLGCSVVPTGWNIQKSAALALSQALEMAGLSESQITARISTGYGRASLKTEDSGEVTEITCHARGARFLDSRVRTVIDIGGQDSKLIRLGEDGTVTDFAMNDKCAAGTGRFLELMASSLGISLEEMSERGTRQEKEHISISSMCSVFAQSEVVSLVAEGKDLTDIVCGLDRSIAAKVLSLGGRSPLEPYCMMTGGVANNKGVVRAFCERIGSQVLVPDQPEICGALGAALIARERYRKSILA